MHFQFAEHHDITDLRSQERLVFRRIDDAGPAATPAQLKAIDAAVKANAEAPKKVNEAIKDGRIGAHEKTLFDSSHNLSLAVNEGKRLSDALIKAGAIEVGALAPRNGAMYAGQANLTDHAALRGKLSAGKKAGATIEGLQQDIERRTAEKQDLTGAAAETKQKSIDALVAQQKTRATDEQVIVKRLSEKTSLLGALAAEQSQIDQQRPKLVDSLGKTRHVTNTEAKVILEERAFKALKQFNDFGSREYQRDLFSDDWEKTKSLTFDKMVEDFEGHPTRLKNWAEHQDTDDQRAAVQQLQGIMGDYEKVRAGNLSLDRRSSEIATQSKAVEASRLVDREVLSPSTLQKIDGTSLNLANAHNKAEAAWTARHGDTSVNTVDGAEPNVTLKTGPETTTQPKTQSKGKDGVDGAIPPAQTAADVIRAHGGLGTNYVVKSGDWLSKISERYNRAYGLKLTYQDLHEANRKLIGSNPNLIYSGQQFVIPGLQERINEIVKRSEEARQKVIEAQRLELESKAG